MAQLFGFLSKQSRPASEFTPAPSDGKKEALVKYFFRVSAVDGSAFTMEVLAPNMAVATRLMKRYPGIVSFEPVHPEGQA